MTTQPISSLVAPRFPAICGRATLTMVVSSTCRIAAVIKPDQDKPAERVDLVDAGMREGLDRLGRQIFLRLPVQFFQRGFRCV